MKILKETLITDKSFEKWKSHRIDVDENDEKYYYYVIPLIEPNDVDGENFNNIPVLHSSYSDEFVNNNDERIFTVSLDPTLPELISEEEVELLYKILTKQDIFIK